MHYTLTTSLRMSGDAPTLPHTPSWRVFEQNLPFTFNDHIRLGEPGSSVGIATGYWLDGPGIGSRWGRDFPHLSRTALGPTQPPVKWVLGLSRGKERPGRDADPSHPSSAVVMKG